MDGQVLHELQSEEWGRQLLALVGTSPVKTTEVTLNFDDLNGHGDHGVWQTFDAGWIVGISVFVPTDFDAGTANILNFAWTAGLFAVNPSTTLFGTTPDITGMADGNVGAQVDGVPFSGNDVTFTPIRSTVAFRVLCGYTGTGTAATQGQAKILFQHVVL